jgi:hypothetical protein
MGQLLNTVLDFNLGLLNAASLMTSYIHVYKWHISAHLSLTNYTGYDSRTESAWQSIFSYLRISERVHELILPGFL